jgi:hypothetical protein
MNMRTESPGNGAGANPPTMKVMCHLTGSALTMQKPTRVHCAAEIYDEPTLGFFRVARFGIQGVLLKRGERQVLISLSELWNLAASVEPGLAPPAGSPDARPIAPTGP